MKKRKKTLLAIACAGLVAATTAAGTMAYFTDEDTAVNTFTVGNVGITLDEAEVNPDGTKKSEYRVQGNEYHLLPGHTYIKDPTVTVEGGSEDSYVRMLVTVERIDQLKAALPNCGDTVKYYDSDQVFLLQKLVNGWASNVWEYESYTESSDEQTGVYEFRYYEIVEEASEDTELDALFDSITVPGEIDQKHLAYLEEVKIVVTAQAMQAAGFADAGDAWTAFQEK